MSSTTLRTTARAVSRVLAGIDAAERDQLGREVDVGLDRLEQLRLEEHPAQVQPLEGVLLHDRHDR